MSEIPKLPQRLLHDDGKFNLYYLNEIYKTLAYKASIKFSKELKEELSITAGIWGGQYLIADKEGYSFTPKGLSIAPKTLANFLERITQLYEQGADVRRRVRSIIELKPNSKILGFIKQEGFVLGLLTFFTVKC